MQQGATLGLPRVTLTLADEWEWGSGQSMKYVLVLLKECIEEKLWPCIALPNAASLF